MLVARNRAGSKRKLMLKRIVIPVFAVLAFASPAQAHHTTNRTYPNWVDAAWESGKRCKRWEHLLRKHDLPVKPFSYIAYRESRCNPKAWNKHDPASGSYGLWQINGSWVTVTANICLTVWGDRTALWNPTCNVKVSAYLFREGGFKAWGW